ncbi:MAG: alpha/beta hydrolase [Gammaproteobacteria bacterium]|nr:alpha/beta hydrolase [Gammaproteobacteria bacterium]
MNQPVQDCVYVDTGPGVRAAVIWLHGLGVDGHDFEPIVPELRLPASLPTRFIFPHAPMRPVTINNGMVMRAWYDIAGFDLEQHQDSEAIRESAEIVRALIEAQVERGIRTENIVLAGFSQGGAIALYTGLRYPQPLAGILALSTYLPLADRLATEAHDSNQNTPIMLAHGTADPVVPLELGVLSQDRLEQYGYTVHWHTYPMQHGVCPQEIADVSTWLQSRLGG